MTFKTWIHNIWFEHCEEFEGWNHRLPDYSPQDYFNKYKWWLRREYRHRFKAK